MDILKWVLGLAMKNKKIAVIVAVVVVVIGFVTFGVLKGKKSDDFEPTEAA